MVQRLVKQVTAPVRWDLCMRTLAELGVTGVIELPPAGTLAGLVKRELKGGGVPEIVTLNTPDDLPAARDLDRPARPHPEHRRSSTMTAGSKILAMGHYQPARVVTNDDLATTIDTNDEWIRAGSASRNAAIADAESVADMATYAAEKALASSGLTPPTSTWSPWPPAARSTAAQRRHPGRQPARDRPPGGYDLNTACSGFSYALGTADHASGPGRPATPWSSASRSCPTWSTGPTVRPPCSSATAPAPRS